MEVREYLSQHETIRTLPLITESARVTTVEAMDRSRNGAVVRTLQATLGAHGNEAWQRERPASDAAQRRLIRDKLDRVERGTPLSQYLSKRAQRGQVGQSLRALQERYLRPYPSLLRICVETDEPVEFVAGQYLGIRYGDTTRPYSVASSPAEDELEFCIRRVPGGRLTPTLSTELEPGDEVILRGPYGDFVMEPPSERDLVFLATGTGVAPFRSMIDYLFATGRERFEGTTRDVWLFLGCGWRDDLPYRALFRELERERDAFHFVPTLSREHCLTDWEGESAYAQYVLPKYVAADALTDVTLPDAFERERRTPTREPIEARLDPDRMEVYACGINAMVYGLVEAVERLGVASSHTHFEGFG